MLQVRRLVQLANKVDWDLCQPVRTALGSQANQANQANQDNQDNRHFRLSETVIRSLAAIHFRVVAVAILDLKIISARTNILASILARSLVPISDQRLDQNSDQNWRGNLGLINSLAPNLVLMGF